MDDLTYITKHCPNCDWTTSFKATNPHFSRQCPKCKTACNWIMSKKKLTIDERLQFLKDSTKEGNPSMELK